MLTMFATGNPFGSIYRSGSICLRLDVSLTGQEKTPSVSRCARATSLNEGGRTSSVASRHLPQQGKAKKSCAKRTSSAKAHIEQTDKVCTSNRVSDISTKQSICHTGTPIAHYVRNGKPLRHDIPFRLDIPAARCVPYGTRKNSFRLALCASHLPQRGKAYKKDGI